MALTALANPRCWAKLHKLPDPDAATRNALAMTEMAGAADRKISTYSKGMRQRIKVAAALVHDPEVLLLDEPFNGMDPRQRLHMMELLAKLGASGRVVIVSSHILEEVERLSGTIQVVVAGRLAASGDFRAIRRLMTARPHPTVAWITLRGTAGRNRALLFAGAPVLLMVLALVLRFTSPAATHWPDRVLGHFGFSVVLPLTALIIGTSVLGAEFDDGSAIHLLATPVSRASVILTKFAVATALTAAFTAIPEFLAGLLAGRGAGFAVHLFAGAAAGSAIYCAVFVLLSVRSLSAFSLRGF